MTVQALIVEARRAGITLAVAGDRLRIQAPLGALTPVLRDALAAQKTALLAVLSRLQGMHENIGKVPVPCAKLHAQGGPGRCFSCGDSLEHPEAYGRCLSCAIAAELFHAGRPNDEALIA